MERVFRFVEAPDSPSEVRLWLRALHALPTETPAEHGTLLMFGDPGKDLLTSPAVTLFLPRVERDVLWTVGEAHFLPKRGAFPALDRVCRHLGEWLGKHEQVFAPGPDGPRRWKKQLLGSVKGFEPPVWGLPSGIEALKRGQVFVGDDDNEALLDRVLNGLQRQSAEKSSRDSGM